MQERKSWLKGMAAGLLWVVIGAFAGKDDDDARVLSLAEGQVSPSASIEASAWMAGNWIGNGFGGVAEESYLPPNGGTMIGMFRHLKDNKPSFYEFAVIVEHEGSLLYRLKHFHPDMRGWEAKDEAVDFPLVKVTDNALYFDGLTYIRTGEDSMSAYVRIGNKDGEDQIAGFDYRRVEP